MRPLTSPEPYLWGRFRLGKRGLQPLKLLLIFQYQDINSSPSNLLRLEFNVDESKEMPLIWILAQTLMYMWGLRVSGKAVNLIRTRTELESRINFLRETRFRSEHEIIKEIFELL